MKLGPSLTPRLCRAGTHAHAHAHVPHSHLVSESDRLICSCEFRRWSGTSGTSAPACAPQRTGMPARPNRSASGTIHDSRAPLYESASGAHHRRCAETGTLAPRAAAPSRLQSLEAEYVHVSQPALERTRAPLPSAAFRCNLTVLSLYSHPSSSRGAPEHAAQDPAFPPSCRRMQHTQSLSWRVLL